MEIRLWPLTFIQARVYEGALHLDEINILLIRRYLLILVNVLVLPGYVWSNICCHKVITGGM
ncbi:hypothetical protein Lser_V15G01987 [Lactuca serriola]